MPKKDDNDLTLAYMAGYERGKDAVRMRWTNAFNVARIIAEEHQYRADDCGRLSRVVLQTLEGLEQTP